jgi:hypothetical protein
VNYFWRAGRYDTWDPLNTNLLQNNVQWSPESEFDARIEKDLLIANTRIMFFMDVNNLFDQKYLDRSAFFNSDDEDAYFASLHLPMYEEEIYQDAGYTPGNDAPGDYRSKDKPYIDMPMIEHLRFTNPRYFRLGLALNF